MCGGERAAGAQVAELQGKVTQLDKQLKEAQRTPQRTDGPGSAHRTGSGGGGGGGGRGGGGREGRVQQHSEVHASVEVLVVDEDMANQMAVAKALEPRGFVVSKCVTADA
eukprot:583299-Rhodomonas_salina.1